MSTFSPVGNGLVPEAAGLPSRRLRLLLIEDQPANAQSFYQAFAPDHDVFMAIGGERALAACACEQPDLVLLDMATPGTDGLTGLRYRRHFDQRPQSEWGRAARKRCAPDMGMLDVDHFNRNHERSGHQAGDECLRRAAAVCDGLSRPELANAPGEAFRTLPFPRKNRPHTRRFVST